LLIKKELLFSLCIVRSANTSYYWYKGGVFYAISATCIEEIYDFIVDEELVSIKTDKMSVDGNAGLYYLHFI
jgi:hypothetical protein